MANKSRDPNAPKRNLSAYLLYQNAMRNQFKAMNPGMTFGQLAKYTSAMYSEMPPAEKEAWVARAEADKARYLHELALYVPPPGYDAKGDTIASTVPGVKGTVSRKSGGKVERDANAPKRNVSAYLLYQNGMREQFKRENPGMTFGQLAKYTSHMYKNLTPEERATWDARAAQDKARYDAQLSQYVPPPGHDARGNMIESNRPRKRSKRSPKDPNAPKRASGAYVFFTNEMRPVVMKQFPVTFWSSQSIVQQNGSRSDVRCRSSGPGGELAAHSRIRGCEQRFKQETAGLASCNACSACQLGGSSVLCSGTGGDSRSTRLGGFVTG